MYRALLDFLATAFIENGWSTNICTGSFSFPQFIGKAATVRPPASKPIRTTGCSRA